MSKRMKAVKKGAAAAGSSVRGGLRRGGGGGRRRGVVGPAVGVVYVDPDLRRVERVTPGERIPAGWLPRCVEDSYSDWRLRFPSSRDPSDLQGSLVPEGAELFDDLVSGKGLVLIELAEHCRDQSLVHQISAANYSALATEDEMMKLRNDMVKMRDDFLRMQADFKVRLASVDPNVIAELKAECALGLDREIAGQVEVARLGRVVQTLNDRVDHVNERVKSLEKDYELSTKVKLRVVLNRARAAVEIAVGRERTSSMTWAFFMDSLTPSEWGKVGDVRQSVKNLLAHGAVEFNEAIHTALAEDVVGAIAGMPSGYLRSAWEHIFFLAFETTVADVVFAL